MPLGTREILVVIRARDVASRVLRQVGTSFSTLDRDAARAATSMVNTGSALAGIGIIMAGVGITSLAVLSKTTSAFEEYSRQVALTKTQVEQVGVTTKQLGDIGKRVASQIPAPFKQMQSALYDIFSSMDVNVTEAELLLREFSRAAVAGQVDVQTAARGTIGILNAWGLEAKDVTRVNDIMFQLVRKGVGTYEEFTTSIGRAVPAAVAAGQSIETLAGMMAFLTRNGLSTEMAATSAARAMELFSDPRRFHKLEELGVTVRDSNGEFLQMTDIINQLANNQAWAKMSEPKRKELFQSIFGQGTIQARRFFDTAIPNYDKLQGLTDQMITSSGALGTAYETMFDEPASKSQLLKNKMEILSVEIGEVLIPAKLKLIEMATKLLEAWNNLDGGTKKIIIRIVAVTAAFLTIAGIVLTVVGAALVLQGTLLLLNTSFGALVGISATIIAALAVLGGLVAFVWMNWEKWYKWLVLFLGPLGIAAVGIVALIKYFDELLGAGKAVWGFLGDAPGDAWAIMQAMWDWITDVGVGIWHTLRQAALDAWGAIREAALTTWQTMQQVWDWTTTVFVAVWHALHAAAVAAFGGIQAAASLLWQKMQQFWDWVQSTEVWQDLVETWNTLKEEASNLAHEVAETWDAIAGAAGTAWGQLQPVFDGIGHFFVELGENAVGSWQAIQPVFRFIGDTARKLWDELIGIVTFAVNFVRSIIENFVKSVQYLWRLWGDEIIQATRAVWDFIFRIIKAVLDQVIPVVTTALTFILETSRNFMNLIIDVMQVSWQVVSTVIQYVWDQIINVIQTAITILSNIIQFVLNIIQGDWGEAWDNIKAIGVAVWEFILASITNLLNLIRGLWEAIWMAIVAIFNFAWATIQTAFAAISATLLAAWQLFLDTLHAAWNLLWQTIQFVLGVTWSLITEFLETTWATLQLLWDGFLEGIKTAWNTVWDAIKTTLNTTWDAIKGVWDAIISYIDKTLLPKFTTVKDWILGVFNSIKDAMGGIWDRIVGVIRTGVNFGIDVINGLANAVEAIAGAIGLDIKIADIAHIGAPYKGGTNPFNTSKPGGIGGRATGGLVDGHPAYVGAGFRTTGPTVVVGEGRPQYPEFVIPTDPMYRGNTLRLMGSLSNHLMRQGIPGFRAGTEGLREPFKTSVEGVLTKSGGGVWVKSGFRTYAEQQYLYDKWRAGNGNLAAKPGTSMHEKGWAVDYGGNQALWTRLALAADQHFPVRGEPWHAQPRGLHGSSSLLDQLFRGALIAMFAGPAAAADLLINQIPFPMAKEAMKKVKDWVYNWVTQKDNELPEYNPEGTITGPGGGGISGGVERWRGTGLSALKATGSPSSWIGSLLRRMQQESGGNPQAINNWDSNARRGTPSKGLMQVIDPTFNSYAGAYRAFGIWNPLANIVASTNYANARYGTAPAGWNRSGGYQGGAWKIVNDQLAFLHRGETVLPDRSASLFRSAFDPSSPEGPSFTATGRGKGTGIYIEHAHFGNEGAVEDLDWWAKTNTAGV